MYDINTKCIKAFYNNSLNNIPNLNLSAVYSLDNPYTDVYRRYKYPSVYTLVDTIRSLYNKSNNTSVILTNCGMSAYTYLYMCYPKHRFVLSWDLDWDCQTIIKKLTDNYILVDMNELDNIQLESNDILITSSLTNGILTEYNIKYITDIAHKVNALVCVDNSVLSPINYNPFDDNADIVIESAGKWLSGYGDTMLGYLIGVDIKISDSIDKCNGLLPNPLDVYLVQKGITTLPIRMERHRKNMLKVLEYIKTITDNYKYDSRVGIIIFSLGDPELQSKLCSSTKLIYHATIFGLINSTIFQHSLHMLERVKEPFVQHIRLSVGLESPKDIIDDLRMAYNNVKR